MLFVWPRAGADWDNVLDSARNTIAHAASTIAQAQNVIILAADQECLSSCKNHPNIGPLLDADSCHLSLKHIPNNDVWIRDFGPLTIFKNGQRHFLDYRFNGWAGKYPADRDDTATQQLISSKTLGPGSYHHQDIILEGGALDSNGAGTLLVTRCCLLDAPRNVGDTEHVWNQRFANDLGITTVHWLDHGQLQGDDTDGHVDTLVRFATEDHIIYQACGDTSDSHYNELQQLATQLLDLKRPDGQGYKLSSLPWPRAQFDEDGRRLPAGYANFLIANQVVLVPQYNDPADSPALAIIAACFPDRQAIGIDCSPLIRQNGAIHCAAMQIPTAPNHA